MIIFQYDRTYTFFHMICNRLISKLLRRINKLISVMIYKNLLHLSMQKMRLLIYLQPCHKGQPLNMQSLFEIEILIIANLKIVF